MAELGFQPTLGVNTALRMREEFMHGLASEGQTPQPVREEEPPANAGKPAPASASKPPPANERESAPANTNHAPPQLTPQQAHARSGDSLPTFATPGGSIVIDSTEPLSGDDVPETISHRDGIVQTATWKDDDGRRHTAVLAQVPSAKDPNVLVPAYRDGEPLYREVVGRDGDQLVLAEAKTLDDMDADDASMRHTAYSAGDRSLMAQAKKKWPEAAPATAANDPSKASAKAESAHIQVFEVEGPNGQKGRIPAVLDPQPGPDGKPIYRVITGTKNGELELSGPLTQDKIGKPVNDVVDMPLKGPDGLLEELKKNGIGTGDPSLAGANGLPPGKVLIAVAKDKESFASMAKRVGITDPADLAAFRKLNESRIGTGGIFRGERFVLPPGIDRAKLRPGSVEETTVEGSKPRFHKTLSAEALAKAKAKAKDKVEVADLDRKKGKEAENQHVPVMRVGADDEVTVVDPQGKPVPGQDGSAVVGCDYVDGFDNRVFATRAFFVPGNNGTSPTKVAYTYSFDQKDGTVTTDRKIDLSKERMEPAGCYVIPGKGQDPVFVAKGAKPDDKGEVHPRAEFLAKQGWTLAKAPAAAANPPTIKPAGDDKRADSNPAKGENSAANDHKPEEFLTSAVKRAWAWFTNPVRPFPHPHEKAPEAVAGGAGRAVGTT